MIVRGVTIPPVPGMLGDDERAVRLRLGDRVADVEHRRHAQPVGEVSAGGLRAALEDVAGGDAGGERSQSSHAQPNSCTSGARINAASVVRPVTTIRAPPRSAATDGLGADVGVGGDDAPADLLVTALAVHMVEAHAGGVQRVEPRQQVVTGHHADRQRHARPLAHASRSHRRSRSG